MVSYEDSLDIEFFLQGYVESLKSVLPTETLSGCDATLEDVIERMTNESPSLIHFLAHGTPGGKGGRY